MTETNPMIEALEAALQRARDMDASLNERLQVIADEVRAQSTSFADAVERLIARLKKSNAGDTAPTVGDPMPPFILPDENGKLVSLTELLKKGPVAVTFHRGYWCPYCRVNTAALAALQETVEEFGGQIVGITPDRQKFTQTLKADAQARFPILTDIDNGYAMSLNLAIWVGQELSALMKGAGFDLAVYQGNEAFTLPIPATFVVGQDGIIRARHVDPDYRKGMETEDLLAALKAARDPAVRH